MHVLIVGAGIAGLTTALELRRAGCDVTVLERQPEIPPDGYMIDFLGPGYDVAERIGLLTSLEQVHRPMARFVLIDGAGQVGADIPYTRLRHQLFRDRHLNMMRGDLARVLGDRLDPAAAIRFGTWPTALDPEGDRITVKLNKGPHISCDLLVGADGVRSAVRALAFLASETSVIRLGCRTAAYVIPRPLAQLEPEAFVSMSAPGLTAAAYPLGHDRTATFFLHRADGDLQDRSPQACRQDLEASYRGRGWILDALLDGFPDDGNVYFDDVVQIAAPRWHEGRVVLVGDAAWCVSLLAGQGASLAMYGGYVLAQEVSRSGGDLARALERYEARLRPLIARSQQTGRRARSWFLPKTRWGQRMRDPMTNLIMRTPAARLLGRMMGAAQAPLD